MNPLFVREPSKTITLKDDYFIAARFPLPAGSISYSFGSESESSATMAAPTRAEFDTLAAEIAMLQTALTNALAAVAPPRA